jgi:hypothetical protein
LRPQSWYEPDEGVKPLGTCPKCNTPVYPTDEAIFDENSGEYFCDVFCFIALLKANRQIVGVE